MKSPRLVVPRVISCQLIGVLLVLGFDCRAVADVSGPLVTPVEIPPETLPELPSEYRYDRSWQTGAQCGPVSLFFLLRLAGKPVKFDEVLGDIAVDSRGCSLADLAAAAERFGLTNVKVIKTAPDQFSRLPKPFIIHWDVVGRDPSQTGHFDVVLGVRNEGDLSVIDTTNCILKTIKPHVSATEMSGYALIIDRGRGWWDPILWTTFIGVVVIDLVLLTKVLSARSSR